MIFRYVLRLYDRYLTQSNILISLAFAPFSKSLLGSMHELIAVKSKARILKNVATFRSAALSPFVWLLFVVADLFLFVCLFVCLLFVCCLCVVCWLLVVCCCLFVVVCLLFVVVCWLVGWLVGSLVRWFVGCFLFFVSCFLFLISCLFVVLFSGVCFLSWCSTLTDDEREDIARMMKRQKYAINDKIIEQGDTSDTFYVIEIGEVQFSVTDPKTKTVKDVGTFFQNQFFGEASLLNNAPRRATATAIAETVCYTLSGKAIRSTFMDFSMRDANLMQLLVSIVKAYIACMLATETQASAAAATVGEVSDESLLTEREMLNAGLPQLDQALLAAIRSTHYMTVHDLEKNVDIIRIRSCKQFDKKTAVARGTATRKKKEEKKRKQQQQREEEERKRRKGIVKHKWVKIKTFTGSTSKFGGKWNSKKTHSGGGGWGTLLKHKS